MPIFDTQPKRAFEQFETHIEEVVRSVLDMPSPTKLTLKWRDLDGVLEFTRNSIGTTVPLNTRYGQLHLSISQDLTALREGRRYRLRTQRYAYKLLPSQDPRAEAVIRWEFDSATDDRAECRNHLHVNAALPFGHGTLDLKRVHVPTAWVLIEHVLRFLFHDLHVPPKTQDWPQILRDSETKFYESFTSKRYKWRG